MKKDILGMIAIAGVLLLSFNSCQIMNKYSSPKVDASNLFRDNYSTDTTTTADIPWRQYFTDSQLQDLIDEGLKNNIDLQIAATRIRQAEAGLNVARLAYLPNVAIAGQVSESQVSNGDHGKDVLGYHSSDSHLFLGIAATWEVDLWGKLNRQSRAKYAQLLNSQEYRNLVQTTLIAGIATSYYSLIALDEQLKITKENVVSLKETVATMQALKDAGQQNAAAVEQSKALQYGTEASIPDLESQIRQTENAICVLLGRQGGSILRSNMGNQTIPAQLSYGVPVQMLAKRADVRQAELSFRSAFELTNAAQAGFYPSITLNSGSIIGYGAGTLSNFFRPENILLNLIGGLTQPLFYQGQLRANLKISKAQQEEALLNFQKTVLSAGREVSDIMYTYESSLKKDETRKKEIDALNTSVDYTQQLLKAGEANYTEVLNAERSLLSAQLNQVSDKLQQLQATANLYRALGGGTK